MKSTIYRFGLLGGLALAAVGCGDDDGTQCGAGTVLQNGVCVADTDTGGSDVIDATSSPDTNNPTNPPDSTSQPDTDATNPTNPTDTFQQDTSPVQVYEGNLEPLQYGDCSSEQWVDRDVSDGCTMSCQCKEGLECMNIPYYQPGFSFCTRRTDGSAAAGFVYGDDQRYEYARIITNPGCYNNIPQGRRQDFIAKKCSSFDDCPARSAAYTQCGTFGLAFAVDPKATECRSTSAPNLAGGTMTGSKVCVIGGLFPF